MVYKALKRFVDHLKSDLTLPLIRGVETTTYGDMISVSEEVVEFLVNRGPTRRVAIFSGDLNTATLGHLLAFWQQSWTVALTEKARLEEGVEALHPTLHLSFSDVGVEIQNFSVEASALDSDKHLEFLLKSHTPGLVLFTSGSTGRPKAAIHNVEVLLGRYTLKSSRLKTLLLMSFSRMGGFDSVFRVLAGLGSLVLPSSHQAQEIGQAIRDHQVDVLPATPSLLRMMLIAGILTEYDCSSIKFVTYGAEVMPEALLVKLKTLLPEALFLQKYGSTELGTLEIRSLGSGTLVKLVETDYEYRVVDGVLEVKHCGSFLGYLNEPVLETNEGWFITKDLVEQVGDQLRFVGRADDVINVAGRKVFPVEVENTVMRFPGIFDVTVSGRSHPLLGQIVCANLVIDDAENAETLVNELRKHLYHVLPRHMVPLIFDCVHVQSVETNMNPIHFKKKRLPLQ